MWISGISQGLMWREYDDMGFLEYAFIEVVQFTKPYHHMRLLGGILYLVGALIMVYNVAMTVNRSKKRVLENAIQS
jgi:cytochrome c oxidase cbb3-type subunit 1